MIKVKPAGLAAVTLLGTTVALGGCGATQPHPIAFEHNGMPAHTHPHQDWWSYQFVYHPQQQVYFEPYTRTYYWYELGLWEQGPMLPPTFSIRDTEGKVVKLQHPKPYIQHHTVHHWHPSYLGIFNGAADPYHATPEAIAQSEHRAAIRVVANIEDLLEITESFESMETGESTGMEDPDQVSMESSSSSEASPSGLVESDMEALTSVDPVSESPIDQ